MYHVPTTEPVKTPHRNWKLCHQSSFKPCFFRHLFSFHFPTSPSTLLGTYLFMLLSSSMSVPSSRFRLVQVVVGFRNKTWQLRLSKKFDEGGEEMG